MTDPIIDDTVIFDSVVLTEDGGYIADGSMSVPNASGNRHHQMVQKWIAQGNTPAPYVAPVVPYEDRRRAEYPVSGDQLDAIWKAIESIEVAGTNIGGEATAILALINAVKARHPKD